MKNTSKIEIFVKAFSKNEKLKIYLEILIFCENGKMRIFLNLKIFSENGFHENWEFFQIENSVKLRIL